MFPDLNHFLHVGVKISLLNLSVSCWLYVGFVVEFYGGDRNEIFREGPLLTGAVPVMMQPYKMSHTQSVLTAE